MIVPNFKNSREYILGITQEELANRLSKKRSTIAGWENGIDTIPLIELIKYANMFDFSLDYLFGLSKNVYNKNKIVFNNDLLSSNLKLLRNKNGFKEEDIASLLGTTQPNYSHYETGTNIIKTTYLYSLLKYYKPFSIDELFGRKK